MGREIRRVPKDWEHPKDDEGHYKPLFDESFESAARKWIDECVAWDVGTDSNKKEYPFFWQWEGDPPHPEGYRPVYDSEPTHYQIYETVSEGTPTSPVFESLVDMRTWLIENGHSEKAVDKFVNDGWAPSLVMVGGKISKPGIDALDLLC